MSIKDAKVQRFGEKLRILRQQRNMTHVELAAQLGYASSSQISLLEHGKTRPTADLIFKVSQFFNVSADDLLNDEREV
jgi:transcriptional regulator with XRE-family HTH domain